MSSFATDLNLFAAVRGGKVCDAFATRTPQSGISCRFAAIHLLSRQKTIENNCAVRGAIGVRGGKVCDAFATRTP